MITPETLFVSLGSGIPCPKAVQVVISVTSASAFIMSPRGLIAPFISQGASLVNSFSSSSERRSLPSS